MDKYFKSLLIRYIKNLKANWLILVWCLVIAGGLVIGSFLGNDRGMIEEQESIEEQETIEEQDTVEEQETIEEQETVEEETENQDVIYIGVNSISKIVWEFDKLGKIDSNGTEYEAKVSNAKETLKLLIALTKSSNFRVEINLKLVEKNEPELRKEDYLIVTTTGYNVLEIICVTDQPNRAMLIEEIVRKKLEEVLKNYYSVFKLQVISQPVELLATPLENNSGYILLDQVYNEEEDGEADSETDSEADSETDSETDSELDSETDNEIHNDNEDTPLGDDTLTEDKGLNFLGNIKSLFSFKNLIIILSAVVLWLGIVLLLTVADNKVYLEKDLDIGGLVCFGKLENRMPQDECVISIINKKIEICNSKKVKIIMMKEESSSVIETATVALGKNKECIKCIWGSETIDTLVKDEYTLIMIPSGSCTNEEINQCVKMLEIVEVKNLGCVLY